MKLIYSLLLCLFITIPGFSQKNVSEIKLTVPDKITYPLESDEINGDIVVSNYEPIGEITGIKANDGNLYVAINDTHTVAQHGLIIKKSTNNGLTWSSSILSLSPNVKFNEIKLLNVGDSLLCMLRFNTTLWFINVYNQSLYAYPDAVKSYDIGSTTSNSLYLFVQDWSDNFYRKSSTNYGRSWINHTNIKSESGYPQLTRSLYGDTLLLTFRDSLGPISSLSKLRQFKYKESSPGALTGLTSIIVLPHGVERHEFKTVMMGNLVWLIYTENVGLGTTALYRKISTNGGLTYTPPVFTDGVLGRNCYWFDAVPSSNRYGMMNLVYYSDSLQSGAPTASSDKMVHLNSWDQNPLYVNSSEVYSQHIPVYSWNYYKPVAFEFPGEAFFGTLWVGMHGDSKIRVYYDKLGTGQPDEDALTLNNISTGPASYELKQNYPNPFNPSTSISFSLKTDGFTSLKIYNLLGQEVASLVNENLAAGSYDHTFNASGLPSGTYFYRLTSGNFTELKKMMLVK
jgi:hypothetical protein